MVNFEVHSVDLCHRLTVLSQQSPVDCTCLTVPAEGLLAEEQRTPAAVAVDANAKLQVCSEPEAEVAGIVGIACIGERLQYYVAEVV